MNAVKIGKAISFLRTSYGMTQRELAEKLNVTDKAVSRWERGQGTPDISLLARLAVILDIDIESLLVGNVTHYELKWKGILALNYPEGIAADTFLYDKQIVFFQLGFFLLTGIREITLLGRETDIAFVKKELGSGEELGIKLLYEFSDAAMTDSTRTRAFADCKNDGGVMIIDKPFFLYGKDISKIFRRILYDAETPVTLLSFAREPLGISFYPGGSQKIELTAQAFERGVTAFVLKNAEDVFDAAALIKITEKHQGEKIGDLKEIAVKRNMIAKEIKF